MSIPRKTSATSPSLPLASVHDLAAIRLFRGLDASRLRPLEGKIRRARVAANETVVELPPTDQLFGNFYFIARGQVQITGLDEEARSKPLNFLRKGEFFVDKSFSWRGQVATRAVAITNLDMLILPRASLRDVVQQYPPLQDRVRELAERIDFRNRTFNDDRYARSVLEFLIDTELTQASRVKITLLDKCIECDICYKSCEDRHGFQRLERGYARFGTLDFAKSCLTCFYPTCIPSCPVDSVVYNKATGEVEILDNCIGCAACERACQYGAIRMYKVDAEDDRFVRFLTGDKKVKPKFIADKCDHCYGYDDMACISNCPTGAFVEVEATELLDNPRVFGAGQGQHKPLPSLIKRSFLDLAFQKTYVALTVLITVWMFWEAYALQAWPNLSPLLWFQKAGFIPADFVLEFRRGSHYCNFLGIVGFGLIFLGMAYPLRKSFPRLFKYLGRQPAWLDFHNFCGTVGLVLVFFHTGFVFPFQPSTFGFLGLILVAASGLFGRFLYQVIPRGVAGTELRMRDIEEEDAVLTKKLDALFEDAVSHRQVINKIVASLTESAKKNPTVWSLVKSIVRTWYLLITFRFRLPKGIRIHNRQTGTFLQLLKDKIRLRRNVAFLSFSSRLFMLWRGFHKALAYIMTAIVLGHIIYNLLFFADL